MATHEWKAIRTTEEAEVRVLNALEELERERSDKRAKREQHLSARDAMLGWLRSTMPLAARRTTFDRGSHEENSPVAFWTFFSGDGATAT